MKDRKEKDFKKSREINKEHLINTQRIKKIKEEKNKELKIKIEDVSLVLITLILYFFNRYLRQNKLSLVEEMI